ncbi:hypothetical protein DSO57_1034110 [Entomophthora muscae]|uniref:Uncharacterized protein n=1 Tax=Entomophthora muscae TaxID=34485 RepID=A0ACC2U8Y3_9FUNG|nr:hypothetical protein DSO57_1034110 [Entomophthora muscae]
MYLQFLFDRGSNCHSRALLGDEAAGIEIKLVFPTAFTSNQGNTRNVTAHGHYLDPQRPELLHILASFAARQRTRKSPRTSCRCTCKMGSARPLECMSVLCCAAMPALSTKPIYLHPF